MAMLIACETLVLLPGHKYVLKLFAGTGAILSGQHGPSRDLVRLPVQYGGFLSETGAATALQRQAGRTAALDDRIKAGLIAFDRVNSMMYQVCAVQCTNSLDLDCKGSVISNLGQVPDKSTFN